MSIQPPSDIILDVALAADPAARDAATRRLAGLSETRAAGIGPTFSDVENAFRATASASAASKTRAAPTDPAGKAAASLETFFLRKAFDAMLPAAKHGGAATGQDMWRSMLAETLANQVAAAGGLGTLRDAKVSA